MPVTLHNVKEPNLDKRKVPHSYKIASESTIIPNRIFLFTYIRYLTFIIYVELKLEASFKIVSTFVHVHNFKNYENI